MFKRKTILELLIEESQKNAILQAQTEQNTANIDYLAMMSDVEILTESETDVDE